MRNFVIGYYLEKCGLRTAVNVGFLREFVSALGLAPAVRGVLAFSGYWLLATGH